MEEKRGREFWEWARERRKQLGLSIGELAKLAGVDRDTITKMEADPDANCRPVTRERIERALTPPDLSPGEVRDAILELSQLQQQLAQLVARSLEVLQARLDSIDEQLQGPPRSSRARRPS